MLKSVSTLGGFSAIINDVSIAEVVGKSLVSVAVPKGGETKLKSAIKKQFNVDLPAPGETNRSKNNQYMLIWMSPDQYLMCFDEKPGEPAKHLNGALSNSAYFTDQSDAWVILEITGTRKLEALERICPINLHPDIFTTGKAARTMMEHLGVLIIRNTANSFLLLSASSSAKSLLHAVETSAENI